MRSHWRRSVQQPRHHVLAATEYAFFGQLAPLIEDDVRELDAELGRMAVLEIDKLLAGDFGQLPPVAVAAFFCLIKKIGMATHFLPALKAAVDAN